MRAHTLPVLVAISLFGCSSMEHKPPVPTHEPLSLTKAQVEFQKLYPGGVLCGSAACSTVTITVKGGCVVSADPPTLGMVHGQSNTVTWKIDPRSTGTVVFGRKGINPKDPGAWKREFERESPGAAEFSWFDKNPHDDNPANQKRKLGYNVDVIQDNRPCERYDPIIINDY